MQQRTCFTIAVFATFVAVPHARAAVDQPEAAPLRPNIVLCMSDDQGWGDTGYNGHPVLRTPNLDAMAANGIRFDRFYAGGPVGAPTRGSCLTGRDSYRYGVFFSNEGHLPGEELTLAEVLKAEGYATGHFGKWHLGTLTATVEDSHRGGPEGKAHFSPPWENGFTTCFSTEAEVPTDTPMVKPAALEDDSHWWNAVSADTKTEPYGTRYWTGSGKFVRDGLAGDDSRIIMDRALPFIDDAVRKKTPFFAVIWFHAPHWPVSAAEQYRKRYAGRTDFEKNYFGCITAMDEQVGRLRDELRKLGVADNTMVWFCSDNGPDGNNGKDGLGSTGPFRGRKRSLYEGGIRVPGLLEWPARIKEARVEATPCSTCDYFSTVIAILGHTLKGKPRPYDGVNLLPIIGGKTGERPRPIGFESHNQLAIIDNRYKLYSKDKGKTWELYDLLEDPGEKKNLASAKPETVNALIKLLAEWRHSCSDSLAGKDYGE